MYKLSVDIRESFSSTEPSQIITLPHVVTDNNDGGGGDETSKYGAYFGTSFLWCPQFTLHP
jgi:hypothetical protein